MKHLFILLAALATGATAMGQTTAGVSPDGKTYYNPVINQNAPDPTIIRSAKGRYYLYSTEDSRHIPIYSSKDLVNWFLVGQAFSNEDRPKWNTDAGAGLWAPDINLINGKYVLYYSMSAWGGEWSCGIGVAVADNPLGPFKSPAGTNGNLLISRSIGVQNSIDPFYIEENGRKYLFWGSFRGIYAIELTDDGLAIKPGAEKVRVAGTMIEGTYIKKHNGYFYLIGSAGSCCKGVNSTYHLVMARSADLLGPYVDKNGGRALDNHFSPLLNGSAEVAGPGHCSEIVEDAEGQHWIMYHGYTKTNVSDERKGFLDKVFWDADGWPYMTGMKPSTASPSPVIGPVTGIDEIDAPTCAWINITKHVQHDLCISTTDGSAFKWQLIDTDGKTLKRGKAQGQVRVDSNDVRQGLYIVSVSGKHGKAIEKIIKH